MTCTIEASRCSSALVLSTRLRLLWRLRPVPRGRDARILELAKGFEPPTTALQMRCSTVELRQLEQQNLKKLTGIEGLRYATAAWNVKAQNTIWRPHVNCGAWGVDNFLVGRAVEDRLR